MKSMRQAKEIYRLSQIRHQVLVNSIGKIFTRRSNDHGALYSWFCQLFFKFQASKKPPASKRISLISQLQFHQKSAQMLQHCFRNVSLAYGLYIFPNTGITYTCVRISFQQVRLQASVCVGERNLGENDVPSEP